MSVSSALPGLHARDRPHDPVAVGRCLPVCLDANHTRTRRTSVSTRRGLTMQTFILNNLVAESERGDQRWREFLRVPSLSMGLYRLKARQADEQQPHTEDEV